MMRAYKGLLKLTWVLLIAAIPLYFVALGIKYLGDVWQRSAYRGRPYDPLDVLVSEYRGRPLRAWVADLAEKDGEELKRAGETLLAFANDQSQAWEERCAVIACLGEPKWENPQQVADQICKLLESDPNQAIRNSAAGALRGFDPTTPGILQSLARSFKDMWGGPSLYTVETLVYFGWRARPIRRLLLPYLQDGCPMVRRQAIFVLQVLEAREAIPDLKVLVTDPDPDVRKDAREALDLLLALDGKVMPLH